MNKLLYTSALCVFSIILGSTASKATDFPDRYRTLDVHAEFTKQSKNFQIKNVMPFHLPDDLPGTPVFKGAKGQFSTTTATQLDASGKEVTVAQTLFGVEVVSVCPAPGAKVEVSMDATFGGNGHRGLFGNIVKQTKGGTQVSNVDFINPYSSSMDMGKNGCGIVYFDGTNNTGTDYTMRADLQLKYTFAPLNVGLDEEFTIGAASPIDQESPVYNAYIVVPVTKGAGPAPLGVMRPGTIFNVGGNISTAATYENNKGNWFVRYITAVYKNNSCQVAFINHPATKFKSNTPAGLGGAPNPTSALWPTATIISDFTVAGRDRDSIMRQVNGNKNLPIHVEDGDCLVQAALPYGDSTTVAGTNMNMESQVSVKYIPD